jgi:hypothetical protein
MTDVFVSRPRRKRRILLPFCAAFPKETRLNRSKSYGAARRNRGFGVRALWLPRVGDLLTSVWARFCAGRGSDRNRHPRLRSSSRLVSSRLVSLRCVARQFIGVSALSLAKPRPCSLRYSLRHVLRAGRRTSAGPRGQHPRLSAGRAQPALRVVSRAFRVEMVSTVEAPPRRSAHKSALLSRARYIGVQRSAGR